MNAFIERLDAPGTGPRVAVKDLIDVEGVPTTAGCLALARRAEPAGADAPLMAGLRAADARIVGKANLHELAMFPFGTNPWFGSPVNPLDPALVPGGSSSGSAVAVANDEADVALGSDTGGSVRIPAACCGIAGLKTTHGRVPLEGVWPLAPSLDTVGPMATSVAGLRLGMELLEPGFTAADAPAPRIGRVATPTVDPRLNAAVDEALRVAGLDLVPLVWDGFATCGDVYNPIYFAEAHAADAALAADDPAGVGDDCHAMLGLAAGLLVAPVGHAEALAAWRAGLDALFDDVDLLALPTLPILPPSLDDIAGGAMFSVLVSLVALVTPFNLGGQPALSMPVPLTGSHVPASLQLVGRHHAEDLLLATAAVVEAAVAR